MATYGIEAFSDRHRTFNIFDNETKLAVVDYDFVYNKGEGSLKKAPENNNVTFAELSESVVYADANENSLEKQASLILGGTSRNSLMVRKELGRDIWDYVYYHPENYGLTERQKEAVWKVTRENIDNFDLFFYRVLYDGAKLRGGLSKDRDMILGRETWEATDNYSFVHEGDFVVKDFSGRRIYERDTVHEIDLRKPFNVDTQWFAASVIIDASKNLKPTAINIPGYGFTIHESDNSKAYAICDEHAKTLLITIGVSHK